MTFDSHSNFGYSTVRTAPSPSTSGTTLTVASGQGAFFPAVPFNAVVWPSGLNPLLSNAEIVRVTNITGDVLTITRTQEGTSARSIKVNDQIMDGITAKTLTDVETAIPASTATLPDSTDKRYVSDAELVVLGNTSGTNTGDQTSVSGNAGTATKLATARNIAGHPFDGTTDISLVASDVGADASGAAAAAQAASQPLDSDLTAIAALSTTTFGRALLTLADAVALRTDAGLVIGTDVEAYDPDLAAIAALTPTNDDVIQRKAGAWTNRTMAQLIADLAALGTTFQPLDSDLTAIAALATTSFGRSLLTTADAAAARTALALGTAATNATGDFDAAGAAAAAQAASQPLDSDLTAIAALDSSTSGAIASDGSGWIKKTYAQFKTALSLVKADVGLGSVDNTADSAKSVASAAILTTARTIDGVSFNGSANITTIAEATHAATSKTTPVDADEVPLVDSAASNVLKKVTWANFKATLKAYFDTLYPSGSGTSSGTNTGDQTITLTGDVTGSGTGSFAATLGARTITSAKMAGWTVNAQTGTTYTLVLGDAFEIVTLNNGSPITLTIPAASSVGFNVGTEVICTGIGVGKVTVAPDTGVTINTPTGSSLTFARYQIVRLVKVGTNTWEIHEGSRPPDGVTIDVGSTGQLELMALTGDVTTVAGQAAATISSAAVTNAKMANMAAKTVKMRHTNSTGAPEDTSMANLWTDLSAQAGADVSMNSQKFTSLSAGGAAGDSLRWEQVAQGVGAGVWASSFDLVSSSALTALMSQSIPANTLGANGCLLIVVEGFYLNNSGAARGLGLTVTFGGTNIWADATVSTFFPASATNYPFFWICKLANENATNVQRVSGIFNMGNANAAATAGQGTIAGGNATTCTFHGTAAVDTTSAQTLLVRAQHSASNGSLELKGSVHVRVI